MSMGRVRRNWTVSDLLKCRVLGLALTLCSWGALAGLAAGHLADAPIAPALGSVRIELRDDHLSVSAREASWAEVLPALERHTGVRIQAQSLLAGGLTCEFEALPLEQGLRRLFREMNTVFLYTPGPSAAAVQLTQVWLWPREDFTAAKRPVYPPTDGTPPVGPEGGLSARGQPVAVRAREAEAQPAEGLTAAEDPETRLQALYALAQQGDTAALRGPHRGQPTSAA
jgi:hypothetical protein